MRDRKNDAGNGSFSGGEFLVVGFEGLWPADEIVDLVLRHRLAGVILYERNCEDPRQVQAMAGDLQRLALEGGQDRPLLVAIDQEQGRVTRLKEGVTLFPSMGELGGLGDPALVEKVSAAVSRELLAVGINWNLAPVADVNSDPSSALGDRSFGEAPSDVASMVAAWVRGAGQAGLAGCLKHFPGHGSTVADSHFASPVVRRDLEELMTVDVEPFRRGIAAGAPAVMTTHITFTAVDPSLPATFSPAVVGGLLRVDLGFDGVAVSDDLEMAGSAERFPLLEGSVAALEAGVDLLLVSRMFRPDLDLHRYVEELGALFRDGTVRESRLREARRRVATLRDRCRSRTAPESAGGGLESLRCRDHLALRDEVLERLDRGRPA